MITILYDGWPLVYQPNSPEALHLLALLHSRPPGVQALVALPGEPPPWLPPSEVIAHVLPTNDALRARLVWEQRTLPNLCRRVGAALLHLTSSHPPLFGATASVVSPCILDEAPYPPGFRERSLNERLRAAFSQGGMARLGGLFWPSDLPDLGGTAPVYPLPPVVYPEFTTGGTAQDDGLAVEKLDLPQSYVLYHGPSDEETLRRLLSAWSWVVGALGNAFPLLALGLGEEGRERLSSLATAYPLGETVRSLSALTPDTLAIVYRHGAALFHPATEPPWGGSVRMALTSGTPVVSIEDRRTDALVGPAAYLAQIDDTRALGAALITVLVEEGVAEQLSKAGRERTSSWSLLQPFGQRLLAAYINILERPK